MAAGEPIGLLRQQRFEGAHLGVDGVESTLKAPLIDNNAAALVTIVGAGGPLLLPITRMLGVTRLRTLTIRIGLGDEGQGEGEREDEAKHDVLQGGQWSGRRRASPRLQPRAAVDLQLEDLLRLRLQITASQSDPGSQPS